MRRLELMLPHSRAELALFFKLSITAGICEELLYRGYLIWYLSHWLSIYPAAALASLLFGIARGYTRARPRRRRPVRARGDRAFPAQRATADRRMPFPSVTMRA